MSVAIFKGKLVKFLAKAGILVPARPDGDRSLTPVAGETAFNTTANKLEVYNGTAWEQLEAGGGGSGNGLVHPTTGSTYESGTANPLMDTGTALNNTGIGVNALNSVAFGSDNTAVGTSAGDALTSGSNNNFFGVSSGRAVTNGIHNNYYGFQSGYNTTTAEYNIGIGSSSLFNITSLPATANVAIGDSTLFRVVSGINNVAIGSTSGFNYNANSSNNTILNAFGPASATTRSGTVLIGRDSSGTSAAASADNEFALGTASHTYLLPGRVGTVVEIGPNGASAGQTGTVRLFELAANGTNYIGVRAPDTIAANINLTLPATVGSANQVLTTDGTSGVLSWATPSATVTGPIYSRSATGTATKIYAKTASDAVVTRAISTWSTPSYWSTASNANSVCWSPELGIFVSVGSQGTLIRASTSNDGVTWTNRTTPESNTFNSVCWSPALGIFCAVASTGANRVMTSPDGINWIARFAGNSAWRSVTWSPELGLFAAVAATTGATIYSLDGITWVAGTGTSGSFQYFSIAWSPELSLFVALGPGSVATSSNGTSWTETAVASLTATTNACVCWSPDLSLFVAVTDSSGVFATSTNGTTWTVRTSPASGNQWVCVTWSPEFGVFCASAITGTGTRIATSVDGINWTLRTYPTDNQWRSICWSPELGIFCAVSSTAAITNGAMVSRDVGVYRERKVVPKYFYRASQSSEAVKVVKTWARRTSTEMNANGWRSICWSPELSIFVAVGDGANTTYVATSPNGLEWTARTPSIAASVFTSVCWSAELNLFVAVATVTNVNAIMTSPDGITWTTRTQTTATPLQAVTWSPELGLFVAVGSNKIISSSDGTTWTDRTSPASRTWRSIVWSSETGQFCAVSGVSAGNNTTIMTSSNGTSWTIRNSIDTNGLQEVRWSPERGVFIATTNNTASNHFAISYDGVTWSAVSVAGLTTLSIDGAALWCAELSVFIATAYASIYISVDGVSWTLTNSLNTGFTINWDKKVWSPELGQFVLLSSNGAANPVFISRKSNILSEILNLRPSRLY